MKPSRVEDPAAAALSAIEEALNLTSLSPVPSFSASVSHSSNVSSQMAAPQTAAQEDSSLATDRLVSELETVSNQLGELKAQIDKKIILPKSGLYLDNDVLLRLWEALELKPGYYGIRLDLKKLFRI